MSFSHVRLEQAGPVLRLILNRGEKRNALSLELMGEVIKALTAVPDDVAVVVVSGEGPAFSAGHDLAEMIGRPDDFYRELFVVCTEMMETLHQLPQPVIAKVHGAASAAGCQLVAACDLAVAAEEATFATPGVKIGLFCSTPMVPVTRAIGRKRAMQMLLTGEAIDAATALDWGLVNQVVARTELDAAVDQLIDKILSFSSRVIGIGKQVFYSQIDLDESGAYRTVMPVMSANAAMAEAQEGMRAFLEKRRPEWPGSSA